MSLFKEWLKKRRLREAGGEGADIGNSPADAFKFNTGDEDFAEDHDHILTELIKTVLRKYPTETEDFLNTFANRGDQEVAVLLKKLNRGQGPRMSTEPRHPSDYDEVVPPSSDTGFNPEGGGGEGG